jgi:allantoicase
VSFPTAVFCPIVPAQDLPPSVGRLAAVFWSETDDDHCGAGRNRLSSRAGEMIAGQQVTRARELLGWSIVDLAHWSGVERILILTFELGEMRLEKADAEQLRAALEKAGVEFTNSAQPGVRTARSK